MVAILFRVIRARGRVKLIMYANGALYYPNVLLCEYDVGLRNSGKGMLEKCCPEMEDY